MSFSEMRKKFIHKVPGFLRHDFLRKLSAVLITFIVILAVKGQIKPATSEITIEPNIKLPVNMEYLSEPVKEVEIKVEGNESAIDQLSAANFDLTINVTGDKEEQVIELSPKMVKLNGLWDLLGNVKIRSIEPRQLSVRLVKSISKKVRVDVVYNENTLADGYYLKNNTLSLPLAQRDVTVEGPKNLVDNINRIATEEVNLSGITQDFEKSVKLRCPEGVKLSFDKVIVSGQIVTQTQEEFTEFPVMILLAPSSRIKNIEQYKLSPEKVTIRFQKPHTDDSTVTRNDFHAMVDVTGLEKEGICPVIYRCANSDVRDVRVIPAEIQVKVSVNEAEKTK